MRYTVTWLPVAEDELMNLWIQASDRQAVTDASNRMERTLKRDADHKKDTRTMAGAFSLIHLSLLPLPSVRTTAW